MIDECLKREIIKANGDGTREAKFKLLDKVRKCRRDMSTPEIVSNFNDILKKHGRVPVIICIAATLIERANRIDNWEFQWAADVINCWTTRPISLSSAVIDDGLHPTRICEYASKLIRLTKEN